MVSFFNDVNVGGPEAWIPAVEYFGTRGFFPSYDAKASELLDNTTAGLWAAAFVKMAKNAKEEARPDPDALAAELMKAEPGTKPVAAAAFLQSLGAPGADHGRDRAAELKIDVSASVTRGDACRLMFALLGRVP